MAKHNKTINHLMIALAALQDGDVEEAQEALTDAVSQDDFDDALEVLDEVQESTFDEEASDEEETEEDEEEDLAPTASIRRSRQAARRRATVAGLNFDIIARNKRSV